MGNRRGDVLPCQLLLCREPPTQRITEQGWKKEEEFICHVCSHFLLPLDSRLPSSLYCLHPMDSGYILGRLLRKSDLMPCKVISSKSESGWGAKSQLTLWQPGGRAYRSKKVIGCSPSGSAHLGRVWAGHPQGQLRWAEWRRV